jgi:hypothetical protein
VRGGDVARARGGVRSVESLTLTRMHIVSNHATGSGGGVDAAGELTILDSTISGNSTSHTLADGGGVRAGATLTLSGSIVSGNSTRGSLAEGGGLFAAGALEIVRSAITGNHTAGSGGEGGGVYATAAATIRDSFIADNFTTGGGSEGGGVLALGDLTIESSTISGNSTAAGPGGGIYAVGALVIANSTVSGNATLDAIAFGGGVLALGPVTLRFSTVTRNSAAVAGGGIWGHDDPVSIFSSIVADNEAATAPDLGSNSGTLLPTFSLIGSNNGSGLPEAPAPSAAGNLIGGPIHGVIDPMLEPLANLGGAWTHLPRAGSPVIDASDPLAVAGSGVTPQFDQRGAPHARVTGGRIDMGAIELPIASADFDRDGDVDGADFLIWQRRLGISGGEAGGPGDANQDSNVDAMDLQAWTAAIAATTSLAVAMGEENRAALLTPDLADAALELRPGTTTLRTQVRVAFEHSPSTTSQEKAAPNAPPRPGESRFLIIRMADDEATSRMVKRRPLAEIIDEAFSKVL